MKTSKPPVPSPKGAESVLALVALGKIDASSSQFYGRALAHLGRMGLIERTENGGYRVAPTEDAGLRRPTPVPPPQLETLVTRVPKETLDEIDELARQRGSSRSEVARAIVAAGMRSLGSGVRKAV